jgi:hypothetical protein
MTCFRSGDTAPGGRVARTRRQGDPFPGPVPGVDHGRKTVPAWLASIHLLNRSCGRPSGGLDAQRFDVVQHRVQGGFEGAGVAADLGHEESALQSGEDREAELIGVGVRP